jgi:hypothetical protein
MKINVNWVDQVLQKSLLCLNLFDFESQIVVEKYVAPTHLGKYLITFLFVEVIIYNYAFFKDPQSIFHAVTPLVVETTCAHMPSYVLKTRWSNIKF